MQHNSTTSNYDLNDIEAYLTGFWLTDLSNFSAFLIQALPQINWAGFYLSDGKKLRLGPFCGKPACMEIPYGNGVCGQAYLHKTALIVDDVNQFPGHIQCDSDSKSEMVVPFFIGKNLVGVFDLDSPLLGRFKIDDKEVVEKALSTLANKILTYQDIPFGSLNR